MFLKYKRLKKIDLDSIPKPSPSVKIQIICGKAYLRRWRKTLLDDVNKHFVFKSLLQCPAMFWLYTSGKLSLHNLNPGYLILNLFYFKKDLGESCIVYLKDINLCQEANHCSINENFTVDNCREKVQRFEDKTDSIFDFGIGCRIHTKYDCMYTIKQTQPFSAFRTLPANVM